VEPNEFRRQLMPLVDLTTVSSLVLC